MRGQLASRWVAGVDGCPAGWLVVLRDVADAEPPRTCIVATFAAVLCLPETPAVIAVDIPIGLAEHTSTGGRLADTAARSLLGKRMSSVFPVPARAAVMQTDYLTACAVAQRHSEPPAKVSQQAFNIFPKIREVDDLMTPALQARVFECHPEVAFWAMNGQTPLALAKKAKGDAGISGSALRRDLLSANGFPVAFVERQHVSRRGAGQDDFLDACACAWSAARILAGTALTFPDAPPLDARGLRQEIRV